MKISMTTVLQLSEAMSDSESREPLGQGSWLRVAKLMGSYPELAIFRRFRKLNVLRILEMQSDLAEQEKYYEYICSLDAEEECSITRSYQTSWESLNESGGKGRTLQRDAWRRLRDGLESYSKHGKPTMPYMRPS